MAIPDYQTLMRPLLQLHADGGEHAISSLREQLALHFKVSSEEKQQRLPSGKAKTFGNRVAWATVYLTKSLLLKRTRRGVTTITDRGRQVLRDNPERVDLRVLSAFPELQEFRKTAPADERQDAELAPDLVPDDLARRPQIGWEEFIHWAGRLYSRDDFEATERVYKLTIAERVSQARQALLSGSSDWIALLRKAFGHPNNLTSFHAHNRFLEWCKDSPEEASRALKGLWLSDDPAGAGLDSFVGELPKAVRGSLRNLATFLLLGIDALQYPPFRVTPFKVAYALTGFQATTSNAASPYRDALSFLDTFIDRAAQHGLKVKDRLDAQSIVWWVTKNEPPADWDENEKAGLIAFRSGLDGDPATKQLEQDGDLSEKVAEFKKSSGYPTDRDQDHLAALPEFASYLSEEALKAPDWEKIQLVFSSSRYGFPGNQSNMNRFIGSADEDGLERLRVALVDLLYGADPVQDRLSRILEKKVSIPGLGEGVATKFLAVRYPQEFLPVYVTGGDFGRTRLMQQSPLSLQPPTNGNRGEQVVEANKQIVEALSPHFGDDRWAMGRFLYWLREQSTPSERPLAPLAEQLLVPEMFLSETIELLRERGQIIFYGPPGTGKTYIARKLMEHLAPDATRRAVVQFHPSYSYEDFVQGYRPFTRETGELSYELKSGPLIRLATGAAQSPLEHVLLIDEINRGNLPKILGELLFLLEYRDEEIDLMYGVGERFQLPKKLLIIGTMNTADRSIGLIDAALRRRFYFIPVFPDHGPLKGLLYRWLQRNNRPMLHVAALVDRLNALLRERFGPHLQVGPSYFMKKGLNEKALEKIWEHDVMPFLEDQLFGHEAELEAFKLHRLRKVADENAGTEGIPALEADSPDET